MIVKNLTDKVKEIEVRDITGSRVYKCYINPYGTADFERMILVSPEIPDGVEVDGYNNHVKLASIVPDVSPVDVKLPENGEGENSTEEEDKDSVEDSDGAPALVNEDNFICDECGAEFASARSLSAHKSRSHNK